MKNDELTHQLFGEFLRTQGAEAPPDGAINRQRFRSVSDPPGVVERMMTFAYEHAPAGLRLDLLSQDLQDVKVAGNRATGTLINVDGRSKEARFVLIGGRWYIDL